MSGRILVIFIVVTALIAGAAMYWLQVYGFYDRVALVRDGGTVELRITRDGEALPLDPTAFTAIDADSSPIRFRACFTVPPGTTGDAYSEAIPLTAPGWFDCFDAGRITQDLASGAARAVLGEANIRYGIDRVLALYPDGRGYAWTQINRCGKEVFDGNPPPAGCPPVPPGVGR